MTIDISTESEKATAEIAAITAKLREYIAALPALAGALQRIGEPDYCYIYPNQNKIICRVRSREQFAPLRALRRAAWEKTITQDDDAICSRYEGRADCGTRIICFVCELPPSCRIVTETIDVAAHRKQIQRVVCSEEVELATV